MSIVASRLQDLRIESRRAKDSTDDLFVEIESVGDDQGKFREIHSARYVTNEGQSVPVASSPDDCRRPETRPNFDRRENPRWPVLVSGKGTNLVCLELLDGETGDRSPIEATARIGCLLEPARHGVPRDTRDPSDRGDADALDSEGDNLVESSSTVLKTVVRRAFGRRERLSAFNAPVSTTPPGPRAVKTVADDVPGTDSSLERTSEIETSAILQFGLALVHERTASLEIGLKL